MAAISINTAVAGGTLLSGVVAAASASGDTFSNDGNTLLTLQQLSTANIYTVNIATGGTAGGYSIADQSVTVTSTAGAIVVAGPFPVATFGRNVAVTYSGSVNNSQATELRVAAFTVPRTG
jgi:hypothetical protein